MANMNCLAGMQCPNCASFGPFVIAVKTMMKVSDNGIEEDYDHKDWGDEAYCECCGCDGFGTVADFRRTPSKEKHQPMTAPSNPTIGAAHTPGPWNDDGNFIVAADPDGIHADIYIAEIAQEDEEGRIASPEQQRANGNLIAAAPDLLDAAEPARESP